MAQPSLTGLWATLERGETEQARRALRHPSCWPVDPTERERVRQQTGAAFPEAEVGVALVVTASGRRGSLFALERAEAGPGYVGLGPVALAAVETARRVVARDAAALMRPRLLRGGPVWRARPLGRVGEGRDEYVEGGSLGVSAALALLSELGHEPVPVDLVASAILDRDGRIGPVEGLERKLDAVAAWGLGVRRFLVAHEQAEEVGRMVSERGLAIEVCGVSDISDVVATAFPDLFEGLRARLEQHPEEAERVSNSLYSLALDGAPSLQDWGSFAKTASVVAEVAPGEEARRRAAIAAAIAQRHCGQTRPLPVDQGWLAQQRRPRRLSLLAHMVQAATDAAEEDLALEGAASAALASDLDRTEGDLRLLGALGRHRVAWHRFQEGSRDLLDAIAGWRDLDAPAEASFPSCEHLRVLGVTGDMHGFEVFRASTVAWLDDDPRLGPNHRAFLTLATVRALVLLGRHEEALAQHAALAEGWAAAPSHVEASAERWRAQALEALGQERDAAAARERIAELAERSPKDAGFCVALADLDAALRREDGAAAERALQRLRDAPEERRELDRIARLTAGQPLPQAVARHWRY